MARVRAGNSREDSAVVQTTRTAGAVAIAFFARLDHAVAADSCTVSVHGSCGALRATTVFDLATRTVRHRHALWVAGIGVVDRLVVEAHVRARRAKRTVAIANLVTFDDFVAAYLNRLAIIVVPVCRA